MSVLGSIATDPVPTNVRCASNSDLSRHGSEMTRSARTGSLHPGTTQHSALSKAQEIPVEVHVAFGFDDQRQQTAKAYCHPGKVCGRLGSRLLGVGP